MAYSEVFPRFQQAYLAIEDSECHVKDMLVLDVGIDRFDWICSNTEISKSKLNVAFVRRINTSIHTNPDS